MRCWALAEEFSDSGAEVTWRGDVDIAWVREKLLTSGWHVELLGRGGPVTQPTADSDIVVIDSYAPNWADRKSLMEKGIRVVAIVDDSHEALGPADVWVNPGVALDREDALDGTYLNGLHYLLIRSEVREMKRLRQSVRGRRKLRPKVVILLGGSDAMNLGPLFEESMTQLTKYFDILVGPGRQDDGSHRVALPAGARLLMHAATADLVISPAGLSSWELAYLGVPMGLVQIAENQKGNYEWLTSNGFALPLGTLSASPLWHNPFQVIEQSLSQIEGRTYFRSSPIDGRGARRVTDAIISML